jgi:hypothetical protein
VIDEAYSTLLASLTASLPDVTWIEEAPRLDQNYVYPAGFLVPSDGQNTSTAPGQVVVGSLGADVVFRVKETPDAISRSTLNGFLDRVCVALSESTTTRIDSWGYTFGTTGDGPVAELSIRVELLGL